MRLAREARCRGYRHSNRHTAIRRDHARAISVGACSTSARGCHTRAAFGASGVVIGAMRLMRRTVYRQPTTTRSPTRRFFFL
jgi:hypothetical protein